MKNFYSIKLKPSSWTLKKINDSKRSIKAELDKITRESGPSVRNQHAIKQIEKLSAEASALSKIRCLIYIISTLVQYKKTGGLKNSQIKRLAELAETILLTEGILTSQSKFKFLFRELKTVLSQIASKEGENWQAAWSQHIAGKFTGSAADDSKEFQYLTLGSRHLRLGYAGTALPNYESCLHINPNNQRALLGKARCLRLMGDGQQCRHFIGETEKRQPRLAQAYLDEFSWEKICLDTSATKNPTPMIGQTKAKKQFYEIDYILEACLWAQAIGSLRAIKLLPKTSSLRRNASLQVSAAGPTFKAVEALEFARDSEIPFPVRLQHIEKALAIAPAIPTLDIELLFCLGAIRVLILNNSFELAMLLLQRYCSIGLTLTQGKNSDPLNIAADIFARDWFLQLNSTSKKESLKIEK